MDIVCVCARTKLTQPTSGSLCNIDNLTIFAIKRRIPDLRGSANRAYIHGKIELVLLVKKKKRREEKEEHYVPKHYNQTLSLNLTSSLLESLSLLYTLFALSIQYALNSHMKHTLQNRF